MKQITKTAKANQSRKLIPLIELNFQAPATKNYYACISYREDFLEQNHFISDITTEFYAKLARDSPKI